MSETTTEETPAVPEPTSDEPTLPELAAKVDKLIDLVTAGGGRAKPAQPAGGGADTRAALARLKELEDEKAAREQDDKLSAAVEEKVKKAIEKPPREYRKVTRFMGWTGDDE